MTNRLTEGVPIRRFPWRGVWRVAPDPRSLPPLPWQSWIAEQRIRGLDPLRDADCTSQERTKSTVVPASPAEVVRVAVAAGAPETPGPSRFDDPDLRFRVRYAGDDLRICLVEKLAQFSMRHAAFDAATDVLSAMIGVEDDYVPSRAPRSERTRSLEPGDPREPADPMSGLVPNLTDGIEQYLRSQRVSRIRIADRDTVGLVLGSAEVLKRVEKDDRIQPKLIEITRLLGIDPPVLDVALTMLAGRPSRSLTQTISRVVYDLYPTAAIAYASRHDSQAWNWAFYADRAAVTITKPRPLQSTDKVHRAGVQDAADHHEIALPHLWQ